jgi:uncharacterized protein
MSEENVEIVRRLMDAYLSGDFETALAAFDPEVEFDVSIRPEGRVYRGRDGVIDAVRTWAGTWKDLKIEIEEIIGAGDDVVVVDRESGRGRASGTQFEQQTGWVYTLREGKIIRAVWFPRREEALEAAGLSE